MKYKLAIIIGQNNTLYDLIIEALKSYDYAFAGKKSLYSDGYPILLVHDNGCLDRATYGFDLTRCEMIVNLEI